MKPAKKCPDYLFISPYKPNWNSWNLLGEPFLFQVFQEPVPFFFFLGVSAHGTAAARPRLAGGRSRRRGGRRRRPIASPPPPPAPRRPRRAPPAAPAARHAHRTAPRPSRSSLRTGQGPPTLLPSLLFLNIPNDLVFWSFHAESAARRQRGAVQALRRPPPSVAQREDPAHHSTGALFTELFLPSFRTARMRAIRSHRCCLMM